MSDNPINTIWSAGLAVFLVCFSYGCDDTGTIHLAPVFPADEAHLLQEANVSTMEIRVESQNDHSDDLTVHLNRGENLLLENLKPGDWLVELRGLNPAGEEVVYGKTRPFTVRAGRDETVKFFLGHSFAFNELGLEPREIADLMIDLVGHAATPFRDENGRPQILVTGGTRGEAGIPLNQVLLIDSNEYTIQILPPLPCGRKNHHALAVKTRDGFRVILAGGEMNCENDETEYHDRESEPVDIFNPRTKLFSRIALRNCPDVKSSLAPELRPDTDGKYHHTGQIAVPGPGGCLFDPLGPEIQEALLRQTSSAGTPIQAASSSLGHMATFGADGAFNIGSNRKIAGKQETCPNPERSSWTGLPIDPFGRLVPLASGEQFLWLGSGDASASADWAIINASRCTITDLWEGKEDLLENLTDFATMEYSTGRSLSVLLVGGRKAFGKRSADVLMFSKKSVTSGPSWYNISNKSLLRPVSLRHPRASHVSVKQEDNTFWIIGGGNSPAEVFVKGSRDFGVEEQRFLPRDPSLVTMTVLDAAASLRTASKKISEKLISTVVRHESPTTVLLYANAYRGIGDNLLDNYDIFQISNNHICESKSTADPTEIEGVVTGNLDDVDLDQDWAIEENKQAAEKTAKDGMENLLQTSGGFVLTNSPESVFMNTYRTFTQDSEPQPISPPLPPPNDIQAQCPWKQYLRVGFDGLTHAPEDETFAGINLLVLIIGDDDCSQGFFTNTESMPDPALLSERACTDRAFDDYFGLPPSTPEKIEEFRNKLSHLSWDINDLILVPITVSPASPQEGKDTQGRNQTAWRILETAKLAKQYGAQIVPIELKKSVAEENISSDELQILLQQLSEVEKQIRKRNHFQVCLPEDAIPIDAAFFEDAGPNGLFAPFNAATETKDRMDIIDSTLTNIDKRCRVVTSRDSPSDTHRSAIRHKVFRSLELHKDWTIGTDSDRRTRCNKGWLLRLNPDSIDLVSRENAYLSCVN